MKVLRHRQSKGRLCNRGLHPGAPPPPAILDFGVAPEKANKGDDHPWHRELYYANRYQSSNFPHQCVTIMHNKMDHAKTAVPVFSHKSKGTDSLVKLPVSVTGMIAHGHGDIWYAHYGLDIFPHDSNYTMIGSMARLLRDLEKPPKSSSKELFVGSGSTRLLKNLLEGGKMCIASLKSPEEPGVPATPLPPILNVQMDNATGDNKNRYVYCFWSLLVANKIF